MYLDERWMERRSWLPLTCAPAIRVGKIAGTVGYATGFGGPPACWLIENHFKRFVVGQDPRDTNVIWDQMFKAS